MRIGFVCQGWAPDPGGVESHTQDLARHLIGRGHEIAVLCLDYGNGRDPYTVRDHACDGVLVRRMAYRYHDHRSLIDLVVNPRAEAVLDRWLRDHRFEVVHVHHLTGFGAAALFTIRARSVPSIMTLHDYWMLCPRGQMLSAAGEVCETLEHRRCGACQARTWPHLFREPSAQGADTDAAWAQAAERRDAIALEALSVPDRLLVPSRAAREVFVRCGVPRERLELWPYGIEVETLAAEARRLRDARPRDAERGMRVGVLGSVFPSKGVLELALAFDDPRVQGVTLEVHGPLAAYHGDASYVDRLRALAARDARIRLHGAYRREDLAAILAGLDAVAVPSRWNEVFGLSAREAAACGLPVLVSDRGGLPEIAEHAPHARVLAADDREAWIMGLMSLRSAPSKSGNAHGISRADDAVLRIASLYAELAASAAANKSRVRS